MGSYTLANWDGKLSATRARKKEQPGGIFGGDGDHTHLEPQQKMQLGVAYGNGPTHSTAASRPSMRVSAGSPLRGSSSTGDVSQSNVQSAHASPANNVAASPKRANALTFVPILDSPLHTSIAKRKNTNSLALFRTSSDDSSSMSVHHGRASAEIEDGCALGDLLALSPSASYQPHLRPQLQSAAQSPSKSSAKSLFAHTQSHTTKLPFLEDHSHSQSLAVGISCSITVPDTTSQPTSTTTLPIRELPESQSITSPGLRTLPQSPNFTPPGLRILPLPQVQAHHQAQSQPAAQSPSKSHTRPLSQGPTPSHSRTPKPTTQPKSTHKSSANSKPTRIQNPTLPQSPNITPPGLRVSPLPPVQKDVDTNMEMDVQDLQHSDANADSNDNETDSMEQNMEQDIEEDEDGTGTDAEIGSSLFTPPPPSASTKAKAKAAPPPSSSPGLVLSHSSPLQPKRKRPTTSTTAAPRYRMECVLLPRRSISISASASASGSQSSRITASTPGLPSRSSVVRAELPLPSRVSANAGAIVVRSKKDKEAAISARAKEKVREKEKAKRTTKPPLPGRTQSGFRTTETSVADALEAAWAANNAGVDDDDDDDDDDDEDEVRGGGARDKRRGHSQGRALSWERPVKKRKQTRTREPEEEVLIDLTVEDDEDEEWLESGRKQKAKAKEKEKERTKGKGKAREREETKKSRPSPLSGTQDDYTHQAFPPPFPTSLAPATFSTTSTSTTKSRSKLTLPSTSTSTSTSMVNQPIPTPSKSLIAQQNRAISMAPDRGRGRGRGGRIPIPSRMDFAQASANARDKGEERDGAILVSRKEKGTQKSASSRSGVLALQTKMSMPPPALPSRSGASRAGSVVSITSKEKDKGKERSASRDKDTQPKRGPGRPPKHASTSTFGPKSKTQPLSLREDAKSKSKNTHKEKDKETEKEKAIAPPTPTLLPWPPVPLRPLPWYVLCYNTRFLGNRALTADGDGSAAGSWGVAFGEARLAQKEAEAEGPQPTEKTATKTPAFVEFMRRTKVVTPNESDGFWNGVYPRDFVPTPSDKNQDRNEYAESEWGTEDAEGEIYSSESDEVESEDGELPIFSTFSPGHDGAAAYVGGGDTRRRDGDGDVNTNVNSYMDDMDGSPIKQVNNALYKLPSAKALGKRKAPPAASLSSASGRRQQQRSPPRYHSHTRAPPVQRVPTLGAGGKIVRQVDSTVITTVTFDYKEESTSGSGSRNAPSDRSNPSSSQNSPTTTTTSASAGIGVFSRIPNETPTIPTFSLSRAHPSLLNNPALLDDESSFDFSDSSLLDENGSGHGHGSGSGHRGALKSSKSADVFLGVAGSGSEGSGDDRSRRDVGLVDGSGRGAAGPGAGGVRVGGGALKRAHQGQEGLQGESPVGSGAEGDDGILEAYTNTSMMSRSPVLRADEGAPSMFPILPSSPRTTTSAVGSHAHAVFSTNTNAEMGGMEYDMGGDVDMDVEMNLELFGGSVEFGSSPIQSAFGYSFETVHPHLLGIGAGLGLGGVVGDEVMALTAQVHAEADNDDQDEEAEENEERADIPPVFSRSTHLVSRRRSTSSSALRSEPASGSRSDSSESGSTSERSIRTTNSKGLQLRKPTAQVLNQTSKGKGKERAKDTSPSEYQDDEEDELSDDIPLSTYVPRRPAVSSSSRSSSALLGDSESSVVVTTKKGLGRRSMFVEVPPLRGKSRSGSAGSGVGSSRSISVVPTTAAASSSSSKRRKLTDVPPWNEENRARQWPEDNVDEYCHQCRRPQRYEKRLCPSCKKLYCIRCLTIRYYEDTGALQMHKTECPRCAGYCNCTLCCAKRGDQYISSFRSGRRGKLVPKRNNESRGDHAQDDQDEDELDELVPPPPKRIKRAPVRDDDEWEYSASPMYARPYKTRPRVSLGSKTNLPSVVHPPTPPVATASIIRAPLPTPSAAPMYWSTVYDLNGKRIGLGYSNTRPAGVEEAPPEQIFIQQSNAKSPVWDPNLQTGGSGPRAAPAKPTKRIFVGKPQWRHWGLAPREVRDLEPVPRPKKVRDGRTPRYYVGNPKYLFWKRAATVEALADLSPLSSLESSEGDESREVSMAVDGGDVDGDEGVVLGSRGGSVASSVSDTLSSSSASLTDEDVGRAISLGLGAIGINIEN